MPLARQPRKDKAVVSVQNVPMINITPATITELEGRLERAMLDSDVDVLDSLLSDNLLFTNHEGRVVSKQADLELHRSGMLKVHSIVSKDLATRFFQDTALVTLQVRITGAFAENPFEGAFRFTRVWASEGSHCRVVAAHSSAVQEP